MRDHSGITRQTTQLYSFIPTAAEGDKIVEKLAPRFKDGTMWLDDGDALLYFYVYLGGVFFFFLFYHFWRTLFEKMQVKQYVLRNS